MRFLILALLMILICLGAGSMGLAQERESIDEAPKLILPPEPINPIEETPSTAVQVDVSAEDMLLDISPELRNQAEISLLLEPTASAAALETADEISRLWNAEDFDAALKASRELDALTTPREVSLGIDWRSPLESPADKAWGGDVRIGVADSVYKVDFIADPTTGHLFAALGYRSGATGSAWSMCFSDDNGQSWQVIYNWTAAYYINDLTITIVADHCYIFFTRGIDQDQVLGYRFQCSDGARVTFPGGASYITAFTTTAPEAVFDVDVVSNIDFNVGTFYRLYLGAITSNGNLMFYWDDETAESWSQVTTGITNADRGLDLSMNVGYLSNWLFASYIDNDATPRIHIDAFDGLSWTGSFDMAVNSASCVHTSIGAYKDTVHCFFDYWSGAHFYVRYEVSYNGGTSYYWGTVNDTTVVSWAPTLCARRGGGVGVSYRYYGPTENQFTWRDYGGWPWDIPPQGYTDHYPDFAVAAIGYIGGDVYGITYITSLYDKTAWYDGGPGCCNVAGDANNDGAVNVGDAVYLINYAFKGGLAPSCLDEGDANVDCAVNIGDAVYLINYSFKGGADPGCGCTGL